MNDGTAVVNTVNLTSVTVNEGVCVAWIEKDGLASSNTVTINGGIIGVEDKNDGGNVYGGYVGGNGKAINNTIIITGGPVFSTGTILCGGIYAGTAIANAATNDAFAGNALNIVETKGIVVKGISNFEDYKFHLKYIKHGAVILTATSCGCSWDKDKGANGDYTDPYDVDLRMSKILHTYTQKV